MRRRVLVTGLGPVSGLGLGIAPTWERVLAGQGAIDPIKAFDASGFDSSIASEVEDFKVSQFVPKTYRKATKLMARDIELAVAAADLAARDAGLITRGTAHNGQEGATVSYDPARVGAHIGAGLIAAELNELTAALAVARDGDGAFDYLKWGEEGMSNLTPLWLLKYLPNMLACHVTIIHDNQGPSNTITCGEASALLSVGESLRVIQRDAADSCFCGGVESKIDPMRLLRQQMTGRLNTRDNDRPQTAVRPFCKTASGAVLGEGGGIVILEEEQAWRRRTGENGGGRAYAEILGFGASQSVNLAERNRVPEPGGRSVALAINSAMRDAGVATDEIDLVVAFGAAIPESDQAERDALHSVFGDRIGQVPVVSIKPMVGLCAAGTGGLDVSVAAMALAEQRVPPIVNRDEPLDGMAMKVEAGGRPGEIRTALVYSCGLGGQNAATVLGRWTS